ncbi:MAG: hypothetical protein AB7U20_23885 [Planctomycetaceae bacterium]
MRTEAVRDEIAAFLHHVPFEPFVIGLESGERVFVEHPENVAFNPKAKPESKQGRRLVIVAGEVSMFTTFDAVTSITFRDSGDGSAA